MENSSTNLIDKKVCVVCNDAGAANFLIYFLKNSNIANLSPFMEGPALSIWKTSFPNIPIESSLEEVVKNSEVTITGTGWMSDLEHDARVLASNNSIKSIAVIDNWTNYRERFTRCGKEVLPDEIWVFDEYAFQIAVEEFKNIVVVLQSNFYLNQMVQLAKQTQESRKPELLYLTQPMRDNWGGDKEGEFQALVFFIKNIKKIVHSSNYELVIRLHPSEVVDKYSPLLDKLNVEYKIDGNKDVNYSIGKAKWVVGCDTYAMFVALESNKEVFSSIPPEGPNPILPHKNLRLLKHLIDN